MIIRLPRLVLLILVLTSCLGVKASMDEPKARKHAVIIGVSDYLNLGEQFDLVGPRNDALLLYDVLLDQGFDRDRMHLLTEDHPQAQSPTKKNIFAVLDGLLDTTRSNDFLFLHFSGHGSQQPAINPGSEIDGLDEIFLAADTENWRKEIRSVPNAITDDEIAIYLNAFRQKNVFVWLVFDSCHSATMTRNQWRSRKVMPKDLGIPQTRSVAQETQGSLSPSELNGLQPVIKGDNLAADTKVAGYVAFFAAQTNEETPEMSLPKRQDDAKTYGLFTYQILSALLESPGMTYRQLAAQVMQNYAAAPWYGTTPMFVGSGLDALVLDNENTQSQRQQYSLLPSDVGFEIAAGFLHGITPGSRFIAITDAKDKNEAAVAQLEVTRVDALTSQLSVMGKSKVPELAFARLVESSMAFDIRLSIMKPLGTGPHILATKLIDSLKNADNKRLDWVESNADIYLLPTKDKLILLTDGEGLSCSKSDCDQLPSHSNYIRLDQSLDAATAELSLALRKASKALNLMRLGSQVGTDALATELIVTRVDSGEVERFSITDSPKLYNGDSLSLLVANYLEEPLDITVLFLGSDYSISPVFPRRGQFNRFMEEEEKVIPLGRVNDKTLGLERLIVIGTSANADGIPANFSYLAQTGLNKQRGFSSSTDRLLRQIAGQASRGEVQSDLKQKTDIHTISWITSRKQ